VVATRLDPAADEGFAPPVMVTSGTEKHTNPSVVGLGLGGEHRLVRIAPVRLRRGSCAGRR
jgi:hypothetical protein